MPPRIPARISSRITRIRRALDAIFQRLLQWLPEKPTATDPILEQLAQWITPPVLPAIGPIAATPTATETRPSAAWPVAPNRTTRPTCSPIRSTPVASACTASALPKHGPKPAACSPACGSNFPITRCASRALFQQARWSLDDGNVDQAFAILDTLRDTAKSPALKGEAAFLEARAAYQNGDPKHAIQLFDEAALALTGTEAQNRQPQAAIVRLRTATSRASPSSSRKARRRTTSSKRISNWKERCPPRLPEAARTAIEEFLSRFPDHPRAAEARLAAAEAALAIAPPDLPFARPQLDTLAAAPGESACCPAASPWPASTSRIFPMTPPPPSPPPRRSSTPIRPTPPPPKPRSCSAAIFSRSGSYNHARLVLEKLAASDTDPARAQAAWLLAARSAALVRTSQSKQEALILFDKAIEAKGPVGSIASLEKARSSST